LLRICPESGQIMASPKSDLPQGTLDLLILKTVALGSVHGYAIAQRLQQISRDVVQVPGGSLYPALHRLENRKLLVVEWAYLEAGSARWQRLSETVGLILGMAEGGPR
jgi:DNA-binding PadR family transcriptional regulator